MATVPQTRMQSSEKMEGRGVPGPRSERWVESGTRVRLTPAPPIPDPPPPPATFSGCRALTPCHILPPTDIAYRGQNERVG